MTTETTPDTSAPADAPETPKATTPAERRARMTAALKASLPADAEVEADVTPSAATNAEAVAEADVEAGKPGAADRLARVREAIAKQAAARKERLAATQRDQEFASLRAELEQLRGRPTIDTFLEEFKRAPAAALRKYQVDPAQHLNLLTKDAITPGSIAAENQLEELRAEFLTDRQRREVEAQQRAAAEQASAYEAERRAIATYIESKADTWPLLSKTPEARRIRLAVAKWAELQDEGVTEYSRDLVADAVEADLEELHKSWTPPASPPAPKAPPPAAASKNPPRTITPQLGAESGAPRDLPWAERKKRLAAEMRRQAAKDD